MTRRVFGITGWKNSGKTTLVPLALLFEPWCTGKIILLEPRRLAARAAGKAKRC